METELDKFVGTIASAENISKVYNKVSESITNEIAVQVANLLKRIIENVAVIITKQISIHEKAYSQNETYKEFVDKIFKKDDTYTNLVNIGVAQKRMNSLNNARSFGLFGLTKVMFGQGASRVEKKTLEWLGNVSLVMAAYNISVDENCDFVILFLTLLELKHITLNAFINLASEN